MSIDCPVCVSQESGEPFRVVDGFDYYSCNHCGSLFIEPGKLQAMDGGEVLRTYDQDYWREELRSARERSRSDGLVRSGEAILYARRPVKRFLDVGAGPGYLLDELSALLPARPDLFHAVEMFPPAEHTAHPNYRIGDAGSLTERFDAGVCVEVVEHLTPSMLKSVASSIARISNPDALWLFNTGMPDYVRHEDPGYLDPLGRGHIVSYGLIGLKHIFEPLGFRVSGLPGKSFAFIAEYQPTTDAPDFTQRFYHPLDENKALLQEGGIFYIAAFESARSYFYEHESRQRAHWAMGLSSQVQQLLKSISSTSQSPSGEAANNTGS